MLLAPDDRCRTRTNPHDGVSIHQLAVRPRLSPDDPPEPGSPASSVETEVKGPLCPRRCCWTDYGWSMLSEAVETPLQVPLRGTCGGPAVSAGAA